MKKQLLAAALCVAFSTHAADAGTHYRLVTEYTMLTPTGDEAGTHVVGGDFTLSGGKVRWTSVTVAPSKGHGQPAGTGEHQKFMEGFEYAQEGKDSTTPEFFKDFPAESHDMRSLVWDQIMFHAFAVHLDKLHVNETVPIESGDIALAGNGTFTNRRVELTLTGTGRRNGNACQIIHYEALLNRFTMQSGPVTVTGRSDYMGDICVSAPTHRIEYGTLFEEVAGTIANIPGAPGPQPLHVIRVANLQRLP